MKQALIFLLTGWLLSAFTSCGSKNETVKFAVFTDIHNDLVPDGEKRLQKILAAAKAEKVDFVIELGDFCHPGADNDAFMKIWNDFPKDKYHVLGNHDMDRCSKEEYMQSKNMPGRYYSFDRGKFHFIVLDANNRFENGEYIPYHKGGYSRPTSDYIDDEQIEWLKKDLAATEKQCIIFSHQSLEAVVKNRYVIQRIFEQENKRAGFKKVIAAFSGHDHTNYSKEINGITYIQLNSASYLWVGEAYESDKRFTEEINEKYPYLRYTIPYEEALWGIVTLDQDELRLKGTETTFIPPTPSELGMPENLHSYPVVSWIRDLFISYRQNELVQSTLKIEADDSEDVIIQKAAHIVPTPNQLNALRDEFIAFIHFGPNTFTRMEWGNGMEDPVIFAPKELDTDQWCEAMRSAGMKKVILTAKHHDGFVLWQSRYTKHGVMSSSNFRDGKGDVLKDLSESCRKYGLKLGIYLSPADLYQIESPEGLYGNLSKYTKRTIPRETPGRPFENKTTFEFEVDDYNEYFLNQLFELLTEYGPMHEVWFDGAHPKRKGGQTYNYPAWKELIRTLAPEAVIFGREDIRWCGNESGNTRDTEWNVITYPEDPHAKTSFPDLTDEDLGSRNVLYQGKYLHYQPAEYQTRRLFRCKKRGKYLHYQPAETNTSIREGWFYRDDTRQRVRSTDDVFDIYERSVGGNSTFLLNIPPNRDGKFSPADVKVLNETGERIRETYGTNLLEKAKGPKQVLDNRADTYLLVDKKHNEIIIKTPSPITFNRLLIQEAIATHGERVEQHTAEAWIDDAWQEIAHATNIGYKRILRFPDVTTTRIRIRFPATRLTPAICNVSAHYYHSHPPQLAFTRDIDGMVSIQAAQHEFHWNAHGEDIARNLNAGFKIYYTTDGSEPGENTTEYTAPFKMANGEVKAVSVLNKQTGPVRQEPFGYIKKDWKILSASSEADNHTATMAFDENPSTYWMSKDGAALPALTIDLGKTGTITGFAYTPQKRDGKGMMAKGLLKISDDGKTWKDTEPFEFGNLVNDPTKRYHYLQTPVSARYIRIETTETGGGGKVVAIAELDFF